MRRRRVLVRLIGVGTTGRGHPPAFSHLDSHHDDLGSLSGPRGSPTESSPRFPGSLPNACAGIAVFEAALGIRSLQYHFFIKGARHSYRTKSLGDMHVSHARPSTSKTASRLCRSQVCTADVRFMPLYFVPS
ncbi:hypothetical protein B0T11DRAFT_7096 [Plectosphaerella cucumerina]|uniref:Uncharacterized protein n=1 Tax=Plectosphaerella cucumerina TaxID=40658 RepID=A0A8K0TUU5_9PEZI|nr:hypothetical protein B0T11DRAFT_7096 [Plectosphaerella cucumerina]